MKSKALQWHIWIFYMAFSVMLVSAAALSAQSVRVKAALADEQQSSGISIQVLYAEEGTLADFCITDSSQVCNFEDLKKGDYQIRAKFFGYQDTSVVISLERGSDLKLDFVLEPVAYNLPNVSVIDKIIGLRKSGDTLQYNLKAYTSGTEQNLGDILNQLPGMQVDENGDVLVRDKKADALLIEGRELVNDQHKLATDGLQSEVVDYIELIENYKKEKEQFVGETENDKVAVNVRLKEESKGTLTGNAELLAGPPVFVSTAVNLFRTTEKNGYSFYFRQNNTGEQGLERPLYLMLEDMNEESGWNRLMRLESLPNQGSTGVNASLPRGLVKNEDYHFALNADNDWGKRISNRLYTTGSMANRRSESQMSRTYFDRNVTEEWQRTVDQNLPVLYARNETIFEWSDRHLTELIVPLSWKNDQIRQEELGRFGLSAFDQSNQHQNRLLSLQPQFEHSYKIKKDLILTASQNISIHDHLHNTNLSALDSLLGLSEPNDEGGYAIDQEFQYQQFQSQSGLRLRRNWGKSYLRYKIQFDHQEEQLEAESSVSLDEAIAGNQDMKTRHLQQSISGRKDFGRGRFALILNHAWLDQSFAEAESQSGHYLLPYAIFVYEYAKKHAFSVSYGQNIEFPGLLYTYTFNQLMGPRSLSAGNLDLEALRRTSSYSLSFFAPPLSGSSILYNLNFSYNEIRQSFIVNSEVKENYVQNEYMEVPEMEQFSGAFFASRQFDKWSFRLQSRLNYQDGFASQSGRLTTLESWQLSNSLRLQSKRWTHWTVTALVEHSYRSQQIEGLSRSFDNWRLRAQASYELKRWNFESSIAYNTQSATGLRNDLWLWDAEIQFRLHQKWRLSLKGNNLLNLESVDVLQAGFQNNFSEIIEFQTFPGQILVGVGYYF